MNGLIRVLLADDHPMFLEGVSNALKRFAQINVIAECTDSAAVENFLQQQLVDVAVLDINMPGQNGIALARLISRQYPHTRVVFLTMYHPSAIGSETLFSPHAFGYVLKNSGSQILSEAIVAAFEGRRYIDPKLTEVAQSTSATGPLPIKLSSREREIIRHVIEGKGNKEIADKLFLSELTVKTHRKNIYQKLRVNNVAGLVQAVRKLEIDM